jgi:hypothetical protein
VSPVSGGGREWAAFVDVELAKRRVEVEKGGSQWCGELVGVNRQVSPVRLQETEIGAAEAEGRVTTSFREFCTAKIDLRRPLDWPDPILYRPLALLPICRPATAGVSATASGNDRDLIRA